MTTIRKSNERGKTVTEWLTSYHSFSFNNYYDPAYINFGPLVVLNDDVIKPGKGFGEHPHRNMEIVTYVLEGALEHKDNTGKSEVLQTGDVGRMSAGTGIVHSEYNHSQVDSIRFLQTWFLPKQQGMIPSQEQRRFSVDQRRNVLLQVASDNINMGGTFINAYATMYVSRLEQSHKLQYDFLSGRSGYVYIADGIITLNGIILRKGDAALLSNEIRADILATQDSEIVLFDVAI